MLAAAAGKKAPEEAEWALKNRPRRDAEDRPTMERAGEGAVVFCRLSHELHEPCAACVWIPCRCLCFGFFLHTTYNFLRLRARRHDSQILRKALTIFIAPLSKPGWLGEGQRKGEAGGKYDAHIIQTQYPRHAEKQHNRSVHHHTLIAAANTPVIPHTSPTQTHS